jgi:Bacterial Ig-like domain (group 3)/Pentapeptide repeats (8 copies)/IPT/TIG domain
MRTVRRRMAFLMAATVTAFLLALGVLQSIPGAARAATSPVVTGISPPSGPETGGTSVTITGTGFTGASEVDFGSVAVAASSFKVNSDTSITATAPATTVAGLVDVTVTTTDGTSATGTSDQFNYADVYTAGGTAVDNLGPQVTAVDGSGNHIDIPYYVKPGGDYALETQDDGTGLYTYVPSYLNLSGGTPKDEWPLWAGFAGPLNTFIGSDTCSSEPWPFHTMSYPLDPNCWQMGIDLSQQGGLTNGMWNLWVPTTVTDASGQTLDFVGFSGDTGYANDAATGQCDSGDIGYQENWPGAGGGTPGVPGAFTGGEEFNSWGGGGVEADYAPQSAKSSAPLIEIGAEQYGRPNEFDCQWYPQNAVVAPQFTCLDQDGSGVASCTATAGVTADGDLDTSTPGGHTLTITATDNNGNTRTQSLNYFVGQPPTITVTPNPAKSSATGWYNASQLGAGSTLPVTVTFSANPSDDSLDTASCSLNGDTQNPVWSFSSGPNNPDTTPDNVPATFTNPGPVTLQIPQGVNTLTCTATDLSGDSTTTPTYTYQVDTSTPPQTQFLIPPQLNGSYSTVFTCDGDSSYDGAEPATYALGQKVSLEWTLADDVSGLPAGSAIVSPDTTDTTNGFATGYTTLDTSQAGYQQTPAAETVDAAGDVTVGQECPYNVEQGSTTTQVTSSANPSTVGNSVTFAATVSPQAPATTMPTGKVAFLDGSSTLGTATLNNGTATFTTSSLTVGSHVITVNYGGDSNYTGSSSAALAQTVTKGVTTTSVTSSVNPSMIGNSVTYTATVSPVPDGGTVAFYDGANTTPISGCGAVQVSTVTGVAKCKTTPGTAGAHNITAKFSGTGTFAASTAAAVTQVVASTSCATLAGCNLHGLNLSGAKLAGANLTNANLSGANLTGANLGGANLTNANLSGANLTGANLGGANLTNANLSRANLTGADLAGAIVTGANFSSVTWSNTTCPNGTTSNNCAGNL